MRTGLIVLLLSLGCAAQNLKVYAIDVEGGKATLYVSPSGESMLLDTGYDGNNGRDADRILAAAHDAGVKQIDYLVITHYHGDHMGGVAQLAARIPIRNFVDHGKTFESVKDV
ncbi:MAG TPA: MBL fold metallo-hydrolase, partial [Candidatus Acidoferrum sp.]|nr:MBL fold metallo-hydrolase [Candidatus Acidoferrum sp.]